MKIRIPKLSKNNNDVKEKISAQPVVSDENKEKKPSEDATIQPKTVDKVEKKPFRNFDKDNDEQKETHKPFFFKRLVDKKLTIILIENSSEVAKQKEYLIKMIKSLVSEGLVSVINYGTSVRQSGIFDVSTFDDVALFCDRDIGNTTCLYDALVDLESLVSKEYMHIEEKENERVRVNRIEVIGIGTCKDSGSKSSKEVGLDCFCKVVNKPEVITKYFCLTEENFMDAAEIGFRSIGAIFRNY